MLTYAYTPLVTSLWESRLRSATECEKLVDACIIAVVLSACPTNTRRTPIVLTQENAASHCMSDAPIAEMYLCVFDEGTKNRVTRYSMSAVPFATWYVTPFSSKNAEER
jgi:hypothetical protein